MAATPHRPFFRHDASGHGPGQSDLLWSVDSELLDLLPVAVYFCDDQGYMLRWNRCAVELWGREPVAGDPGYRYCGSSRLFTSDGQHKPHSQCAMADALRTGQPQRVPEIVVERPDGSRRVAMATIDPIRDASGALIGAVNVLQDITERKKAEDALSNIEKRFRHLLEKLPAAAYTCDSQGLITYFNERAVELWGRAPRLNDAVDRFCGSFLLFATDGSPIQHDQCWMALALRDRKEYCGKEIVIERPDGSRRAALAYATPFFEESGDLAGALNVLVDITDRNQARDRINELLVKEQEQSERLREADRRKDEFLAMLAHELRNPLAPIRSGLDVLTTGDTGERQAIKLMRSQVNHLVRLVDDLLDVSRIVHGRVELRRTTVDLMPLIQQSLDAIQPTIARRKQQLVLSLPQAPVWLNVDSVRLVQVIENLLNNASKYTDKGGRIELKAECRDSQVTISIEDDGVGIEPELLPKVFELFTQSRRALDRAQGGLGIGLTLVKNLVEMHGGSVAAFSNGTGQGSRFVIQLPIAKAASAVDAPTGPSPATEGRRILVVDDNVGAAKMLSLLVSRLGPHEIEMAHDGRSAIEKTESFKPDIVLLDIGLPVMDGFTVARKLRAQEDLNGTLLVALTGYGQDEDRQKSAEAGFDEHLVKPVDMDTLKQLLGRPKTCSANA